MSKYPNAAESGHTELALQESEAQFRSAMENSPIGMGLVSPAGRWLNVNEALCRIVGYTRAELLAIDFQTITHPDDLAADRENVRRILNREISTLQTEKRYLHKDGHIVWIFLSASLVRSANGEPRYFISHIQDITERKKAEEELRRDAEILAQLEDAIVGCDKHSRVVLWNSGAEKLFGWKKEEILGRDIAERFPLEIRPHIGLIMAEIFTGNRRPMEWEDYRKDGSRVWVYWRARALYDATGRVNGMVAVATDIHARKTAETQIHLLAHAVQTANEMISITDLADRFTFVNPAFLEAYGYDKNEVLGRTPEMLAAAGSSSELALTIQRQARETGWAGELMNQRKDGSEFPIHLNASPVWDTEGHVIGLMGVARDITERRQYENRLREQAELLDKAQDAIMVKDLQGHIQYWNKSAERLHGWTAAEMQGRPVGRFLHKDSLKSEQALLTVMAAGTWNGEFKNHTKTGGEVLVESRWTLVRDAGGRPQSILSINTDITEKKRIEAQFLRNQRLESIGTLACGISHDLNNVLAPIMISISLLREKITDAEGADILQRLEINAVRGADIVRQVLSFGRGVQGERILVQPKHLVREIEQIIHATFPKSVEFKSRLNSNLWAVTGDPTQLHQVLLNLCLNARDAMPAGGSLQLSARNLVLDENSAVAGADQAAGDYVVIEVRDTGTGIPAEIRDQIFDPFFTTKAPGQGTGLGLFTALSIIKSHGGFIHLQSELNRGSVFQVYLPASTTAARETPPVQTIYPPVGNGEHILVVDDESVMLEVTGTILKHYGYEVTTAMNGASAVDIYARNPHRFDLVLADMIMPVMDGYATVRALRKINPAVKIIAATGMTGKTAASSAEELAVEHWLAKPFTAEDLLKAIKALLGKPGPGLESRL